MRSIQTVLRQRIMTCFLTWNSCTTFCEFKAFPPSLTYYTYSYGIYINIYMSMPPNNGHGGY